MSRTFKITFSTRTQTEVRRFVMPADDLNMKGLFEQAKRLFKLSQQDECVFKWRDDEGDLITLSEDEELYELLSSYPQPDQILRLELVCTEAKQSETKRFGKCPKAQHDDVLPQIGELFSAAARELFGEDFGIDVSVAAFPPFHHRHHHYHHQNHHQQHRRNAQRHAHRHAHQQQQQQQQQQNCNANNNNCNTTYVGYCDLTLQPLHVGTGQWFHRSGTKFDLCLREFEKLPRALKSMFVLVNTVEDLGADKCHYQQKRVCGHRTQFETKCPRNREFSVPVTIFAQSASPSSPHAHPNSQPNSNECSGTVSAVCDVTGTLLRLGKGWYHKVGTTYDLSETAFSNLNNEQQFGFVRVDSVADLGDDLPAYQRTRICVIPQQQQQQQAQQHQQDEQPFENVGESDSSSEVFVCPFEPFGEVDEFAETTSNNDFDNNSNNNPTETALPSASVVSGPSIASGARVTRGAHLVVVWEIRNDNTSGIWTDVRVKPVPASDNFFQVPEEGFEVPMLEAQTTGLVSIDLHVPTTAELGEARAVYRLVNEHGDVFGPELVVQVEVEEESVPRENELVSLLVEMGFHDIKQCVRAVRAAKGDVRSAALALLRVSTTD